MIITFSYIIEEYIKTHFECRQIVSLYAASGVTPVYQIDYKGKKIAFYKTYIGAPCTVGLIEDVLAAVKADKSLCLAAQAALIKKSQEGK